MIFEVGFGLIFLGIVGFYRVGWDSRFMGASNQGVGRDG